MRVLFRVDASMEIGSGHAARCRVLADELVAQAQAECHFIGRDPDGIVASQLDQTPHVLHILPEPTDTSIETSVSPPHAAWLKRSQADDLAACRSVLGDLWNGIEWLVVDHYGIDATWEREFPGKVFAIDDLADRDHACDILFDQNLRVDAWKDYQDSLEPGVRLLSGPRYALLRNEFRQATDHSPGVDLFVSFGGADPGNDVMKVIAALEGLPGVSSHVAVSGRHPALAELRARVRDLPGCHLHVDHEDLAYLMRDARLAIGAGGGMAWERCACSLPSLAWPIAENQRDQLSQLERAGAVELVAEEVHPDPERLAGTITKLLQDHAELSSMAAAARSLCDGAGASRACKAMLAAELHLRAPTQDDARMIWKWRNDPEVRSTAFDPAEIPWEDHERWFARSLENPGRLMRIAEFHGDDAGFIRLDRDNDTAEVSIFLSPARKGSGLGPALLASIEREIPGDWNCRTLRAGIRPENEISISLFENAGYRFQHNEWRKPLKVEE
ncbi:MAG: UDP-2,4-diacetamido-2,4,6-trideoxy-beta-L-altropyranose hydrolase [Gammaproteobacteria bacterium]|nr:UDP-2,4-diacetamido-2,4,6-trideoxy-beta-L-altropyranose hydrolase [Gammaproteobacteria bacterium]